MTDPSIRPATNPPSADRAAVSDDARAMMMFEARKKSTVVAYLLWFFLWGLGGHRFYCGKVGTGVLQLLLSLIGWPLTIAFGFGYLLLIPLWIWVLIDAFLIPGWIDSHNSLLAREISGR